MALKQQKKKKSKTLIIAVIVVVVIIGGLGAYSYMTKKNSGNSIQEAQEQQQENDVDSLTAEQKKIYESYSADVVSVAKTLKENSWSDSKQVNNISFGDCSFVEHGENNSTGEKKYFVICNIAEITGDNTSNSSDTVTTNITCLDNQQKYFNMVLIKSTVPQYDLENPTNVNTTDKQIYTLSSSSFTNNTDYVQGSATSGELTISISDDVMSTMPFEKSALMQDMTKYINSNYPQATKCTFSAEYYVVLLPTKQWTLYCSCNNKNTTKLQVTYDESTKKFSIDKRKS